VPSFDEIITDTVVSPHLWMIVIKIGANTRLKMNA